MAGLLDFEGLRSDPMRMGLLMAGLNMIGSRGNDGLQNMAQGFGKGLLSAEDYTDKRYERELKQQMLQRQLANDERQNRLTDAQINHYNALNQKATQGPDPYYQVMETSNGLYRFNARTGGYEPMKIDDKPLMRSTSDPARQGEIANQKSGNTYVEFQAPDGSKFRGTNYDFGASAPPAQPQQNNFNFQDPQKAIEDLRASGQNALADQVESQYAQQKYDAFRKGPMVGPSLAYQENAKTQGDLDRKKGEANIAIGKDQTQSRIDAEKSANFQQEILDRAYRYLYPEDDQGGASISRDKSGRLIPPEKQMIYGASPADRIRSTMYDWSNYNDAMGTNTKGLKRLTNEMVMAATGGKLGAGISNADVEFLKQQQGVIDKAQNINEVYDAFSNIEDRISQIKSRSGNAPVDPLLRVDQQNNSPVDINSLVNKWTKK